MDPIDKVRQRQVARECDPKIGPKLDKLITPLLHRPEVFYTGCIDARLNPVDDIGFTDNEALIARRFGALVKKSDDDLEGSLEYFLNRVPLEPLDKMRHIIIAGHTHCGAINTCLHANYTKKESKMRKYLETNLGEERDRIADRAVTNRWSEEKALRALEKESVRKSYDHLMEFPCVKEAIAEGKVKVHVWLLDTANKRIYEMDNTPLRAFHAMGKRHVHGAGR